MIIVIFVNDILLISNMIWMFFSRQDIGAVTYVRRVAPNLPIHGSTQMSITDHHGALFANALGINRVVVGRELSISEMEKVVERANNVEIEAFVHGALCVSYSGQCYSSEAWGGRSANRGQCAQACRMPYGLIVNGTLKSLEQDVQYLLSPQDLMAVDYVPQLIEAGVKSFKIEGRLKGPEYVALTTRAYRNAIDEIWDKYISKKMLDASELSIKDIDYDGLSQQDRRDLVQVFSRGQDSVYDGLSAGFLLGVKHQNLVRGNAPRHRGLYIGHVLMVLKGNIEGLVVELVGPIKRGDGIVIDRRKPEEREEGGTVYEVYQNGKSIPKGVETEFGIATLMFASGAIDFSRISKGDLVWRSKDPTLEHRLKDELNQSNKGLIPVQISISGNVDQPLKVTIQDIDGKGLIGVGESITLLTPAKSRGISVDDISKAIGKLGGTTLRLDDSSGINISNLTKNMFLPVAELKLARRKAVTAFISQLRYNDRNKNLNTDSSLLDDMRKEASILANSLHLANPSLFESNSKEQTEALPPKLSVLCRTPLQVFAACRIQWLEEIVLDFLEVHGLRDMVHVVQSAGKIAVVAMPRIIKPDEDRLLFFYLRLKVKCNYNLKIFIIIPYILLC
jgi:collagenase-like PrtC family protease